MPAIVTKILANIPHIEPLLKLDDSELLELTDNKLELLGIEALGLRIKILKRIQCMYSLLGPMQFFQQAQLGVNLKFHSYPRLKFVASILCLSRL